MSCKSRNIYSFCLLNCTSLWVFAYEYLADMRYECRVTSMMKLIVSWYNRFDVSNLLDLNFWQSEFGSHCFELWVFYTIESNQIRMSINFAQNFVTMQRLFNFSNSSSWSHKSRNRQTSEHVFMMIKRLFSRQNFSNMWNHRDVLILNALKQIKLIMIFNDVFDKTSALHTRVD